MSGEQQHLQLKDATAQNEELCKQAAAAKQVWVIRVLGLGEYLDMPGLVWTCLALSGRAIHITSWTCLVLSGRASWAVSQGHWAVPRGLCLHGAGARCTTVRLFPWHIPAEGFPWLSGE